MDDACARRTWFLNRHLLPRVLGDVVMKDPNDSATLDWVTVAQDTDPIAVPPELAVVINQIVTVTLQDLLAEYND